MHINPNNSGDLPHLSPLHSPSPYFSPLRESAHGKLLDDDEELLAFSLHHDHLESEQPHPEFPSLFPDEPSDSPHAEPLLPPTRVNDHEDSNSQHAILKNRQILTPIIPPDGSKIQTVIEYLVENSKLPEETLMREVSHLLLPPHLHEVFHILLPKFRKLKKTKEEMTKYCMRKAFKFITDHSKTERTHSKNIDSFMKKYFEATNSSVSISIPFKKNSSEKTMNGSFLRKVFSERQFVKDYQDFLEEFPDLMKEDNEKKIRYLADLIEDHINNSNIKKIQSIKRLPWTKEILLKTGQLSKNLLNFADDQPNDDKKQLD